jgi:two-component system CheB/CheR fusion protein
MSPSDRDFYPGQPRPSYDRIDLPEQEDEVKDLLKRSIEAANNSIVLTDPNQPDNPLIYINQGFMQLTGYDEDEILGYNCRFLQRRPDGTRDDDQPAVRTLSEAISKGEHCRAVIRNYRKNGEMFWNELYLTPVYDATGALVNYIGVQNDITERIRLNETLERRVQERTQALERKTRELEQQRDALEQAKDEAEAASRAKSTFLANMSHEIRTPLTAILGLADVIRAKSEGSQFDEHISRIKSAGSRLMDTLSSLLTLAKLEAGNMQVELQPVAITDETLEVVELFRERAEEKGLTLDFSVTPEVRDAIVNLDAGALNSALQNLISNAIKFTQEGEVEVAVRTSNHSDTEHIAIDVRDTGIGISNEFRPYLFDDFRQESDGLTREHEGSGLGLAITKQLVEAMEGTIEVESERGSGSTFTVTFPVAPDYQLEEAPDVEEDLDPPREDARVLLIEDNDNTIFLVRDLLEQVVELDVERSAQDAVDRVTSSNGDYDMFLIDINLGAGGSGVDVLQRLRETDTYADAPMVAVTAIAMPGDRESLLAKGFDAYLAKPFEAADLLALIDQHL